ncbi:MMPL family transporter [Streptomyces armeniacus]|uniref:MMPL family transporter n=1 Tax=Streptomyces armeniacus TaxID=83291 RepID=A0A345XMP2_9ACTN|nr:MMPL family transporter [Streptomyces armeniacus]AXK32908.1 MMPL family transporter [Streptomyces armeniacus]
MAVLARWCFRHRIVVFAVWLCALLGTFAGSSAAGTGYTDSFELPGTESTRAADLMAEEFPQEAGSSNSVVWRVPEGRSVRDAAVRADMSGALADIAKVPEVGSVAGPYGAGGDSTRISEDGRVAYATVTFTRQADELEKAHIEEVMDAAGAAARDGLRVGLGGDAVERAEGEPPGGIAELVGLAAAAVILFLAFGSLYAMLLPLLCAVFGIGTGLSTVGLISHVTDLSSAAPLLGSLIGLGVGIDYALFIVTRHRSGVMRGLAPEEAAVRAVNTAGRAVLFAGGTVCIALLGMMTLGIGMLDGVAIAASLTVLLGVLAAVTLLPAMLGLLGPRVLSRRQRHRLAVHGPAPEQASVKRGWGRWAAFVQRRPRTVGALATVVMVVVALPVLSLRLGTTDQGNNPESSTTRQAYDMLADGFGPGFNGPLQLVAETPGGPAGEGARRAALDRLVADVRETDGVARTTPPSSPGPDSRIAVIQVVPETAPQSAGTDELIDRLRDETLREAEAEGDVEVLVTGSVAFNKDFAEVVTGKLPMFIGVIVALGFVLLLIAFRSVLVPLTAALMNLLAAAASFGLLVAIFQWGWGSGLLGLGDQVPITSFLPVIMLAMLFGLSMDYQVFLVSRMHEEWVHTKDSARAVRVGLAETSRVITSAALIMVCVFSAFVLSGDLEGVMVGLGLAGAVALDAFILRMMLVPAAMFLLGRANWWLPHWLDRRLPHLAVEPKEDAEAGPPEPEADPEPEAAPQPRVQAPVSVSALAPVPVPAGEQAAIRGTVHDAAGIPVPRASLTLISAGGNQLAKSRTAQDGSYSVTAPGEGAYILVATSPGLGAAKSRSVLLNDGPVRLDLRLDRPEGDGDGEGEGSAGGAP